MKIMIKELTTPKATNTIIKGNSGIVGVGFVEGDTVTDGEDEVCISVGDGLIVTVSFGVGETEVLASGEGETEAVGVGLTVDPTP